MENHIKIRFLNIRENYYHDTGETRYSFVELFKVPVLYILKSQCMSCNKKNCQCDNLSQLLSEYICYHVGYKVPIFCISFEKSYVYAHGKSNHFEFAPDEDVWNVILVDRPFGVMALRNKHTQNTKLAIYNQLNYMKNTRYTSLNEYVLDQYSVSDPENYTWTLYNSVPSTNLPVVNTKKPKYVSYLIPGISAIATMIFMIALVKRWRK